MQLFNIFTVSIGIQSILQCCKLYMETAAFGDKIVQCADKYGSGQTDFADVAVCLLHFVEGGTDILDGLFFLFPAQQKQEFPTDIRCYINIRGKLLLAVTLKYREIFIAAVMLDGEGLFVGGFNPLCSVLGSSAEDTYRNMDSIYQKLY